MKASVVVGIVVGYVLGARAGRQRYEDIVAMVRRITGSQTIQATAGVMSAQVDEAALRVKDRLTAKLPNRGHHASSNGRVPGSF